MQEETVDYLIFECDCQERTETFATLTIGQMIIFLMAILLGRL